MPTKNAYVFGPPTNKNKYTIKAAMAVPGLKKLAEENKDITIKALKKSTALNAFVEFQTNTIYVGLGFGNKVAVMLAYHELSHIRTRLKAIYNAEKLAWSFAKKLAKKNGVKIDEQLIKDCLDSYKVAFGLK